MGQCASGWLADAGADLCNGGRRRPGAAVTGDFQMVDVLEPVKVESGVREVAAAAGRIDGLMAATHPRVD